MIQQTQKKKCFTISNACPSLLHIKDILTYAYSKKSADTNITGENGVGLMQAIPALARGALILTVNANDTVQIGVLPDSPKMGESEQCTLTRPYGLNNQTDRVRATFQA